MTVAAARRRRNTVLLLALLLVVAVVVAVVVLRGRAGGQEGRVTAASDSTSSLLVLTWAPSLCEVSPSNSGCRSGHVQQLGQTFVLHGLWPQPSSEQYCDVPKNVSDRKREPVHLPDDLKTRLKTMTSDLPLVTTHEWYAHGTCSGVEPPEYFAIAAELAGGIVGVLNPVFAQASGNQINARSVRQAVATAFGEAVAPRVGLACKPSQGGEVMYEVRLSLPAVVDLSEDDNVLSIGDALHRGPVIGAGCGMARVP